MKIRYVFLLFFVLFVNSYGKINLPEVYFPLEITTKILEEKPFREAPTYIELNYFYEDIDLNRYIKPYKPLYVNLPLYIIEKPTSYLGIPPSNALLSEAIDYFNKGDFLFAKSSLETFLEKYKDNKYLYYAYYLLGVTKFNLGEIEESQPLLYKSCQMVNIKEICLSTAIVDIVLGNFEKSKSILSQLNKDNDTLFYNTVIDLMNNKKVDLSQIECNNLDIGSIEYCKYIKKYFFFSAANYGKALDIKIDENLKEIKLQSDLMDSYSLFFLKNYDKALENFDKLIQRTSNGYIYNLSLYGKALIQQDDIKKYAYILESRDEYLAYSLYLQLGNSYFQKGKSLDAFIFFQKAINLSSTNKTYLKKAIATSLYNLGKYDYALKFFSDLANETKEADLYLYAGFSAYQLKNFSKAQEFLENAINTENLQTKKLALIYLAEVYLLNKEDEKFVNTIDKLKDIDSVEAYDLLGWYFFENQDYQNAYKAFKDNYMKAVSAFNSNDIQTAKNLIQMREDSKSKFLSAYIQIKEGNIEKAQEILKNLSSGSDDISEKANYLYAYLYFSSENYQKAVESFRNFIDKYKYKDDSYTKKAILRLADSYYNLGEKDLARSIYADFIKKYSNTKDGIDAAYSLILLESKDQFENQEEAIKNFIEKYPNYPLVDNLKLQLASLYNEKGKLEDAIKIYNEIIKSNSVESDFAKYKLAEIYFKMNDIEKAKSLLVDIINKNPNNFDAKLLLGDIYEQENQYDEAINIYSTIKDNDDIKFKIAKLLILKGDYQSAIDTLKYLLDKYPDKANDISFYIGKAYFLMKKFDEAIDYLLNGQKSSNYQYAAESYYLLGLIYKNKDLNKALNFFLNTIYLYPDAKEITAKARLEAADILIKFEKLKEASCLITPLENSDIEEFKNLAKNKLKNLPKCVR